MGFLSRTETKEKYMNLKQAAVAMALGTVFSTTVFAQGYGYGRYESFSPPAVVAHDFERRDAINNRRIEQGIRTGQLTPREAWRLRAQQARIERMEARARWDGVIDGRERARIEFAQNDLSRM